MCEVPGYCSSSYSMPSCTGFTVSVNEGIIICERFQSTTKVAAAATACHPAMVSPSVPVRAP